MFIFFTACWVNTKDNSQINSEPHASDTSETTDTVDNSDSLDTAESTDPSDTADSSDTVDSSDTSDTGEANCTFGDCDLSLDLGDSIAMDFAFISVGEEPLERYSLTKDFYLMTTEVTQDMFIAIMGYDSRVDESTTFGDGSNVPAYWVNWHMAAAFANQLTIHHNDHFESSFQECYDCSGSGPNVICSVLVNPYECTGFVLPTDAEWEYAARSGTTMEYWTGEGGELGGDANLNSCGNAVDDTTVRIRDYVSDPALTEYAWFCGNQFDPAYFSTAKPVGLKTPNGYGLFDMHGNMKEWTSDLNGCDFPNAQSDPYCDVGSMRVSRGGYWNHEPSLMSASKRIFEQPDNRSYVNGFRIGRHP